MNITHIRYAIEVAKCGSLTKASENLIVAQPNLSRAIKELEQELNIQIFKRSAAGMSLTEEGYQFIARGKELLVQCDELENMYKNKQRPRQLFSLACPRAAYIADSFARFSHCFQNAEMEVFYHETAGQHAIRYLTEGNYGLGIIRYKKEYARYFEHLLEDKGLEGHKIVDFRYVVVVNKESPLVKKRKLTFSDLLECIEVEHGNPSVQYLSFSKDQREGRVDNAKKIYVFERASQYEILRTNPLTYMWMSPVSKNNLERNGLVELICDEYQDVYTDILIYQKDRVLSKLEKQFIEILKENAKDIPNY